MKRINEVQPIPYQHRGQSPKDVIVNQPTKPTREQCKKLVGRLLGLPFAPSLQGPIEVLIDALQASAESLDHAKAVIDAFALGECERCPCGYEIQNKAGELRTIERRPDPDCQQCFGSGFPAPVEKGGYMGVPATQDGKPIKCTCWRPVLKAAG
jgi:hypothetical protein